MKREVTFPVVFNYFYPGTYVVPTSSRHVLAHESGSLLFKVTKCIEPSFPGVATNISDIKMVVKWLQDDSIVFIEGHKQGVSAEYLREATSEEIEKGDRLAPIS